MVLEFPYKQIYKEHFVSYNAAKTFSVEKGFSDIKT